MRRSGLRLMLAALAAWVTPARAQSHIGSALLTYAASALAQLIETSRQRAIADGVRPVPPLVHRALLGYFPVDLLQKARFAGGGANALTLPTLAFSYGDATTVTVGEVVLFKSERLAQSDLKLWAHELTHVMQYQRWGVAGFADRYVRDSAAVEQEAIDNANRFMAWLARRGG